MIFIDFFLSKIIFARDKPRPGDKIKPRKFLLTIDRVSDLKCNIGIANELKTGVFIHIIQLNNNVMKVEIIMPFIMAFWLASESLVKLATATIRKEK